MLIRHLLYPSELSSLGAATGIEPVPPRTIPGALTTELRQPFFIRRNTDTQRAPRRPGPTARTRGRAKERAYAPTGFRIQDGIFGSRLQQCIFAAVCGAGATAPRPLKKAFNPPQPAPRPISTAPGLFPAGRP